MARRRSRCCSRFCATSRRWPTSGASSPTFATRIDRFDLALDAYKHYIELKPHEPTGYIGAGSTHLRSCASSTRRASTRSWRREVAPERDTRSRASAHELLAQDRARAARRRRGARRSAARARGRRRAADAAYIDGRLLYDQGKYAEALPLFEQAIAELKKAGALQIAGAALLHGRHARAARALSRGGDGVPRRSCSTSRRTRAPAAGLAMLYQATGRSRRAPRERHRGHAPHRRRRRTATRSAARLFTMFGNAQQANAVRAEARAHVHRGRAARQTRAATLNRSALVAVAVGSRAACCSPSPPLQAECGWRARIPPRSICAASPGRTCCSSRSTRCAPTRWQLRRTGGHAGARSPGGRRRALHLRARARRRHAAVAREHPHRPLSVPARRARQQRLSPGARTRGRSPRC